MGALHENRIHNDDPALGSRVAIEHFPVHKPMHVAAAYGYPDAARLGARVQRRDAGLFVRPPRQSDGDRARIEGHPASAAPDRAHHAPSRRAPRSAVPRTASPRSAPPSLPTRSSPCARTATHRETTGTPECPESTTRTPLTWSSTPSGPSTCGSQFRPRDAGKATPWWGGLFCGGLSGGVLLSHTVSRAVPSALRGLASGFGMGPGVSPSL